mmetsp:Transcript_80045/g.231279  ORF Transcript_80045/g.231279 Transcript_80045/m.231279 type:complete len:271 (-) Transcript_80045:6-818(-)
MAPSSRGAAIVTLAAAVLLSAGVPSASAFALPRRPAEPAALAAGPAGPLQQTLVAAPPAAGLRFVGAAFGKTGTVSTEAALHQLGLLSAHGAHYLLQAPDLVPLWRGAFDSGDFGEAAARLIGDGIDGTLDFPFAFAYKELAGRFPDALVILTVHPGGVEGWWRSMYDFHAPYWASPSFLADPTPVAALVWDVLRDRAGCDIRRAKDPEVADACKRAYTAYHAEVEATVPSARLLRYNVSDGWGPLCAALGLPAPATEFPHLNVQHPAGA